MSKRSNTWWVPVGSFALAVGLALVAGPASRAIALRARQATTGCTVSCEIGARGPIKSNVPSNGTLQPLNGGRNRGSLDATGGSGYDITIVANVKGIAGP